MNVYLAVSKLDELYANNGSYDEKLILVMKIQGYTTKQAEVSSLKNIVAKELENNSKATVRDMLMNNYGYSQSGAYKFIERFH